MPDAHPFSNRLLDLRDVSAKVGLGKSSIYRMVDSGTFPAPRQVGAKAVRWLESEIDAWMEALPQVGIGAGIPQGGQPETTAKSTR